MFDDNEVLQSASTKFQFQLLEKLGQGSFGTVYKGIDTTDGLECAVKVLVKSDVNRSLLEGKLLKQLDHPNIVKFKRFGETKSMLIIIMELMKGGTLSQLIKTRKSMNQSFTDEEASCIMKGILSAVDYMHSQNILHRDLKPENILLVDADDLKSVKIADFGLGIQYSSEMTYRSFYQQCGTVFFMAPEQLKEQPYSKPVDVWSCGIIMYMLLSMGKHPFNLSKEIETKEQYIKLIISDPKIEDWPDCSDLAIDLIQRLTHKKPTNRYGAGKALNHPWITRKLDNQIPLSFEENRQYFQDKRSLINIIKTVFVLKMFKHLATKKQVKRIPVKRNQSSPFHISYSETSPSISSQQYVDNMDKSRKNTESNNIGILSLNSSRNNEFEEEKSNSSSFILRDTYNSPQRKKDFMIKKMGACVSPQAKDNNNNNNNNKKYIPYNAHTPSFFKSQNVNQIPQSQTQQQNKTQTSETAINSSHNNNKQNNSTNNLHHHPPLPPPHTPNQDNFRKHHIKDFKITQSISISSQSQQHTPVNSDNNSKYKLQSTSMSTSTTQSNKVNQSHNVQDNFLPLYLKLQGDNIYNNSNNSNNLQYNNNGINNTANQQINTNNNNSVNSSFQSGHNINNNNNIINHGQINNNKHQSIIVTTTTPIPNNKMYNVPSSASNYFNKQRQLRQNISTSQSSSMNNQIKDFYGQKDIIRRIGTTESKLQQNRSTRNQLISNNNNNHNIIYSHNGTPKNDSQNIHLQQRKQQIKQYSEQMIIKHRSILNHDKNDSQQLQQYNSNGNNYNNNFQNNNNYNNNLNFEDIQFPPKRSSKSSRNISTFYESSKVQNDE